MSDRFDEQPLKAEVIDMDKLAKTRNRPSSVFSERVTTAIGSGPDDPGYRYLFDDPDDENPRRGSRTLQQVRSIVLTVVLAMGSAWVVWSVPGFGPQEHQSKLLDRLAISDARLSELESQLAQAQARVVELTKSVEIQHNLIDQGESLRRSMTSTLEKLAENSQRIAERQASDIQRIETLETGLTTHAAKVRRQGESIDGLDSAISEGLIRVQFSNEKLDRKLTEVRREIELSQRDTYFELTKHVQEELSVFRQNELKEIRDRVERLAHHVWNEIGRLDGRIIRFAQVPEPNPAP